MCRGREGDRADQQRSCGTSDVQELTQDAAPIALPHTQGRMAQSGAMTLGPRCHPDREPALKGDCVDRVSANSPQQASQHVRTALPIPAHRFADFNARWCCGSWTHRTSLSGQLRLPARASHARLVRRCTIGPGESCRGGAMPYPTPPESRPERLPVDHRPVERLYIPIPRPALGARTTGPVAIAARSRARAARRNSA